MPFVCATFVLICAAKMNVCAGLVFEILNILFLTVWRHSPPHVAQIAPNQRSSFVLDLCPFVPLNQTLYLFSFRIYNQIIFGGRDVTLHPSSSKSHKTGVIRLCSICAGLCCWNERQIYFSFLEITKTILGSDVTLHPMASKSLQTGAIRLCSICAGLCRSNLYCIYFPSSKITNTNRASDVPPNRCRSFVRYLTSVKLAPHPTQNVSKLVSVVCAPFVL